jgi:hypothetical protein
MQPNEFIIASLALRPRSRSDEQAFYEAHGRNVILPSALGFTPAGAGSALRWLVRALRPVQAYASGAVRPT